MVIKKEMIIKIELSKEEAKAVNVVCDMLHDITHNCIGTEMTDLRCDTNYLWSRIIKYLYKWEEKEE